MAKRKTELLDHAKLRREVAAAKAAGLTAAWNDGGGLKLVLTPAGRARFVHRYSHRGRTPERWFPGQYPADISLTEARRLRDLDMALLAAGKDPLMADEDALAVPTLEAFCRQHFARLAPPAERDNPDRSEWMRDMTHRIGHVGKVRINDVRLTDVEAALRPYWKGDCATPSAERLVGRISRAIELWHALERPDDDTWVNPISMRRLKKRLGDAQHVEQHRPSLPFEKLPALMGELAEIDSLTARLLEFTILTGVRAKEARGARWGEIDWRARTWTVPAGRMKGRKAHVVPLSLGAVRVLRRAARAMPCRPEDPCFPSLGVSCSLDALKPLSNKPATDLLRRLRPGVTLHGMRSSLTAWGVAIPHRRHGPFELQLMDKVLAHIKVKDHDQVSAAIRAYAHNAGQDPYLARRRVVMREWSRYLCPPVSAASSVVPLLRAAA
jgi:integrase